jgi:hypothetical protein
MLNFNALPNFIVIGARRSGTTSLYYYLKQHPDISISPIKETNFFAYDPERMDQFINIYERPFLLKISQLGNLLNRDLSHWLEM